MEKLPQKIPQNTGRIKYYGNALPKSNNNLEYKIKNKILKIKCI